MQLGKACLTPAERQRRFKGGCVSPVAKRVTSCPAVLLGLTRGLASRSRGIGEPNPHSKFNPWSLCSSASLSALVATAAPVTN